MKFMILAFLAIPHIAFAFAITEQGVPRHKLEVAIDLDEPDQVEVEFETILQKLSQGFTQIHITGDFDGDGKVERIQLLSKSGFLSTESQVSEQARYEVKSSREAGSGMATGRRMMSVAVEETGVEDVELGGVSFRVTQEIENSQFAKRAGKAKYKNIVLRFVSPDEVAEASFRKGWDGSIKGGKVAMTIQFSDANGRPLASILVNGAIADVIQSGRKGLNAVNVAK